MKIITTFWKSEIEITPEEIAEMTTCARVPQILANRFVSMLLSIFNNIKIKK